MTKKNAEKTLLNDIGSLVAKRREAIKELKSIENTLKTYLLDWFTKDNFEELEESNFIIVAHGQMIETGMFYACGEDEYTIELGSNITANALVITLPIGSLPLEGQKTP